MQTKRQIQQLLASAAVTVKKRLGQHFLIDLNLMRLLIESANIGADDIVLEVGCGTGSLTEAIAERAGFCLAIEYDKKLADIAKKQLEGRKNVGIINTDILQNKQTTNPIVLEEFSRARRKYNGRLLLVANLPYNVASPVILNLATGPVLVDAMYVTIQKEVAERMTAKAGNKDYGILSIILSAHGEVKIIRALKPTVFWPQPTVGSAMVSFVRNQQKVRRIKDIRLLMELVKLCMSHRRKTLIACTKFAKDNLDRRRTSLEKIKNWRDIFEHASIDPRQRPEQISPEDYITIANLCYRSAQT